VTVLVVAESRHGSTEEIAERIADRLREHGIAVDVMRLASVDDLGQYDAYVVGSGIYLGNWLKEMRRFIEAHADELAQRPTWLFASGSIVGDPPESDDPIALRAGLAEKLVRTTHARELKLFGGKLDNTGLGFMEKMAVRGAHAKEGDYRDWQAIDAWAATIAQALEGGHDQTDSTLPSVIPSNAG
jgi:menaquinone-dependent protoporphyrinogen oxidase